MRIDFICKLLKFRLKIRNIPYDLPRKAFERAREHYYDNLTKHYIAIHQVEFKGRDDAIEKMIEDEWKLREIITIHPIKPYQKLSRINSGRWKKYEQ